MKWIIHKIDSRWRWHFYFHNRTHYSLRGCILCNFYYFSSLSFRRFHVFLQPGWFGHAWKREARWSIKRTRVSICAFRGTGWGCLRILYIPIFPRKRGALAYGSFSVGMTKIWDQWNIKLPAVFGWLKFYSNWIIKSSTLLRFNGIN